VVGNVYVGNGGLLSIISSGKLIHSPSYPSALAPALAWHPGYQGWLLSYQDTTATQRHIFVPLDHNANPAFSITTGFFINTNDNRLACPMLQSYPVVDLRFEEL